MAGARNFTEALFDADAFCTRALVRASFGWRLIALRTILEERRNV